MTSMRVAFYILKAAFLGGCVAGLAGCQAGSNSTQQADTAMARRPYGQPVWNGSETVFQTQATRAGLAARGSEDTFEYARNDQYLAIANVQPITAAGDWPVPEQPDLLYPRYIYLPTSPNNQVIFVSRQNYYGRRIER